MPEPNILNPIITGSLKAWRQSWDIQYDPNTGQLYLETYDAFLPDNITGIFNQCVSQGIAANLTFANGRYRLSIHDTTNQANIDTWQLQQNEQAIAAQRNPRHAAGGAYAILTADMDEISATINRGSVEEFKALKQKFDTANKPEASRLLERLNRGETHFAKSGYVLRHTTNVAARSTYNVADNWVDRIYTTNQLIRECRDTGLWTYPIPSRLQTKLLAVASAVSVVPVNYWKGWIKKGSTESSAANFRVDITTEYHFDVWSLDEYASVPTDQIPDSL